MRSEFEKWYRDKYQITKPLYFFENTKRYEDGFAQDALEVWQHQQSKVDELQKRVDKAIRLLVEAELYQSEPNIDLAVQALKGTEP